MVLEMQQLRYGGTKLAGPNIRISNHPANWTTSSRKPGRPPVRPQLETMAPSAVMDGLIQDLGEGASYLSTLASSTRNIHEDYGPQTTEDVAALASIGNCQHDNASRDFQRWLHNLHGSLSNNSTAHSNVYVRSLVFARPFVFVQSWTRCPI